ncbi:MAG: sensor histidine kinase [Sulfurovum sp.]|nr:sensor histidine kinase [Sulfurovum sp.]
MQSTLKIILLTTTIIGLFVSYLSAEETKEDFAMVSMYEMRGETHVYESNRSKTRFRDINVTFSMLKSNDKAISIDNITQHDSAFVPVPKTEKFQDTNTTYWLKVDLGASFPSGRFVYSYADADFTQSTITPSQQLEKFVLEGRQNMKFTYTAGKDAQVYYFKLVPKHYRIPFRFVYVSTPETFYEYLAKGSHIQLILGLILGLIIMAGIYNAAMYYYNKDISFLYYALMQLFMALILHTYSGAFVWDEDSFFSRNIIYGNLISLVASLFATLFTLTFLEVKTYLPKLYSISRIIIVFLLIDMLISLFYKSIIIEFYILPFLMLALIYAGYKRVRQGYKPAYFYLAGWIVLTLAVFLNIFQIGYKYLIIDPLYIGAAVEAILFSLALSYKMRMQAREKEQQKELLVHQSKLASMGEMIGNIAHQWRQPLTHLGYTMMNLKEAQKHGELDEQYLSNKVEDATTQIAFMSQTIDDFKDFYEPNKEKEDFSLVLATKETLEIMKNTFKHSDIEVELIIKEDTTLHNYKNEYKQVLLNLLSNAKDALVERVTISPKVTITIEQNKVTIEDNAGGIQKELLSRIYEPYFSTKEGNTGIGLYMSKMIVERNMGGKLSVITNDTTTSFVILF